MILSKKNQFVFIKGKKVAGTSVEVFLSSLCGNNDIITPITPIDEKYRLFNYGVGAKNYDAGNDEKKYLLALKNTPDTLMDKVIVPHGEYHNHMSLNAVINKYGLIPKEWTIFCVERCPYRKVISLANMLLTFNQYKTNSSSEPISFTQINECISKILKNDSVKRAKNIQLYKNNENKIDIHVLRHEKLNEELSALLASRGIHKETIKLPHLKKGLGDTKIDVKEFFQKKQILMVNDIFKEEFDTFGYQKYYT